MPSQREQYQSKEAFALKTAMEVEQMQLKAEKLRQEVVLQFFSAAIIFYWQAFINIQQQFLSQRYRSVLKLATTR